MSYDRATQVCTCLILRCILFHEKGKGGGGTGNIWYVSARIRLGLSDHMLRGVLEVDSNLRVTSDLYGHFTPRISNSTI